MALVLKTNETLSDAAGVIPYLEKDPAIVRGVTLGLVDFSNTACLPVGYNAGAALTVGSSFPTLTNSGVSAASSGASFDAGVTNGGLNGSTVGNGRIELPDSNFALPADGSVTRALIVLWAKVKTSGYPTGQGNNYILLAGDCNSAAAPSPSNSRGFLAAIINSSGVLTSAFWNMLGAYTNSAALFAKMDGQLHQYALEYVKSGSDVVTNLYVDKVLRNTRTTAAPAFGTPLAGKQRLFSDSVFNTTPANNAGNKIYRYAVHNLSSRPDLTAADMLARDWDSTIGYVS